MVGARKEGALPTSSISGENRSSPENLGYRISAVATGASETRFLHLNIRDSRRVEAAVCSVSAFLGDLLYCRTAQTTEHKEDLSTEHARQ